MKKLNYISLLIISLPISLSVGCGRINPSNINYAPGSSMAISNYSSINKFADNYSCPSSPNVVPNMNQTVDGSNNFKVCTSKIAGDFSNLLITGKFSPSNSLCVIPLQLLDPAHFTPKFDVQGNPIYACAAPTAEGVFISSPMANSANFNAIIVVESPELNNLVRCIKNNYTNCPNYSFGEIR
jgi:hypothetical protein